MRQLAPSRVAHRPILLEGHGESATWLALPSTGCVHPPQPGWGERTYAWAVELDLRLLKHMHPRLPKVVVDAFAHSAAIALAKYHAPPTTQLMASIDGMDTAARMTWVDAAPDDAEQLDRIRVTEGGAEAVALALVSVSRGWACARRLQRGESADWLLKDRDSQLIALEVSGIDGMPQAWRLAEKLRQAGRATITPLNSACVVAFEPPSAELVVAQDDA